MILRITEALFRLTEALFRLTGVTFCVLNTPRTLWITYRNHCVTIFGDAPLSPGGSITRKMSSYFPTEEEKQRFMSRAIELSEEGASKGYGGPYGSVIVKDGKIVGQ